MLPPAQAITTFTPGWFDYNEATNPAGYYKDAFGIVHLTGSITGGPPPSYAFTLPAGYRATGFFASGSSNANTTGSPCTIVLFLTGDVFVESGCNGAQVGLDGITFLATH
jgi:hypothetical protein